MVFQRGKPRASKFKSHELRIPAFKALNVKELTAPRSRLIEQVGNAFYISGMPLAQLKEKRLYRNTDLSFDEFCQDIFGYSSDYAYLKIAAAKVYQNLLDCGCQANPKDSASQRHRASSSQEMPTNGRQPILPTRQRQLRPIVKAKLEVDAQVEVWQMAIAASDGKISSSIVAEAVNLYLADDETCNLNYKVRQFKL